MALSILRLRRSLTTLSTLRLSLSAAQTSSFSQPPASPLPQRQSRLFRSSSLSSAARSKSFSPNEEIGPDTILFEGCDYNHWLITMDFPKDNNKPSPEEMVRTYELTCAKGLNISVEEAKKKIYACSTTTYKGFQAMMTEEESDKFNGLEGVVFVLPDSYIDVQNKEYGGDKYINGEIIRRPPPFQYERRGSRINDRNRNPDQPRYDGQGSRTNSQGNIGNQTSQFNPNKMYGPPGQVQNRDHAPVNSPVFPYQGNSNQQVQRNGPQVDQRTYAPSGQGNMGNDRNYGPAQAETPLHGSGGFQGHGTGQACGQGPRSGGYGQGPSGGGYGQPSGGGYGGGPSGGAYGGGPSAGGYGGGPSAGGYGGGPSAGGYGGGPSAGGYGGGPSAGGYGGGPSAGGYGQGPSAGGYGQGPSAGGYGQGPSAGGYGQGSSAGGYGQGPSAGGYKQGPSAEGYGQGSRAAASGPVSSSGYPGREDQRLTQGEQRNNTQGENTKEYPWERLELTKEDTSDMSIEALPEGIGKNLEQK